jgi:hypothetical protein
LDDAADSKTKRSDKQLTDGGGMTLVLMRASVLLVVSPEHLHNSKEMKAVLCRSATVGGPNAAARAIERR